MYIHKIYIYEYYSPPKENKILAFATIQMDFEGIILRETSKRKTNTIWSHSDVESKKRKGSLSPEHREEAGGLAVAEASGEGEIYEGN